MKQLAFIVRDIVREFRQRFRYGWLWVVSLGLILSLSWGKVAQAQLNFLPDFITPVGGAMEVAPVWLDGYRLFHVAVPRAIDDEAASPAIASGWQRAQEIQQRLYGIVHTSFDPQKLVLKRDAEGEQIVIWASTNTLANEQIVMTVTELDAQLIGSSPTGRAAELIPILRQALVRAHQERQPDYLIRQAQKTALLVVGGMFASGLLWRWQRRLKQRSRYLREQQGYARSHPNLDPTTGMPLEEADEEELSDRPLYFLQRALQQPISLTQQLDVNLLKRSLLQLSQIFLLGGVVWISLGFFPYTRSLQLFLFSTPLKLIGVALVIYVGVKFLWVGIDKFLAALRASQMRDRYTSQRFSQRISTLSWVLKGVATVMSIGIGVLAGLIILGVNLLPLIAGLGAFALAVSLAAQHIVRDILNGLLILLEDQYAVGDVIVVGNVGGFVESMSLRLTQLRNDEGRLISIPHSAITMVENLSKEWSRVDFTIDVAYDVPINDAFRVIHQVADQLYGEECWRSLILEPPEVLGVDEIDHAGVLIRVWLKTKPLEQWTVAREFRYRLKCAFEQEGIRVGTPQQTLGFHTTLELTPRQPAQPRQPVISHP